MRSIKEFFNHSTIVIVALFVVALLAGFGVSYAVSSSKDRTTSSASCKGTCVYLQKDKASPDTITVKLGDYVQFNSADGKPHSLSLGDGGEEHSHTGKFSSGEFKSDEAWKVQFNEEGSFVFHDHFNPKINILVVVYTPGKDYKVQ